MMKIKNQIYDTIITAGAFIVQPTSDKRTMFAGVIHDELFESIENKKEKIDREIWVCEIQITNLHRFERPPEMEGMRIDQILCSRIDFKTLKKIEE